MVDPQVLIFAGGMSRAGDLLLSRVRERMEVRKWTCLPQDTPMMVASSENAGSVGAAMYALRIAQRDKKSTIRQHDNAFHHRLGDANTMLGAGAGVLALVLWKLQSSQVGHRCPIAGKSMACGLSAIAIYSFVLPWFSAFRH